MTGNLNKEECYNKEEVPNSCRNSKTAVWFPQ